jgi:pyruvate dehydrogenase E2 component (dihydrolipoamide acetyltransferase)
MMQSLQQTAQYTICVDADLTDLVHLRRQLFEGPNKLRVGFIDIAIKAVAEILKRYPRLNAVVVNDEIRVLQDINIRFAVALNEGLVVPVVHNADRKSLPEIAQATRDLAQRAREHKLTLDEIQGGTFTVTAPGFVDVCTPILYYPECAILGVGRIAERPAVHEGQIVPRSMVMLSLSLDHRAVDGAPAAAFLHRLQQLLERPQSLFEGFV